MATVKEEGRQAELCHREASGYPQTKRTYRKSKYTPITHITPKAFKYPSKEQAHIPSSQLELKTPVHFPRLHFPDSQLQKYTVLRGTQAGQSLYIHVKHINGYFSRWVTMLTFTVNLLQIQLGGKYRKKMLSKILCKAHRAPMGLLDTS